jgi:hypothetical protein
MSKYCMRLQKQLSSPPASLRKAYSFTNGCAHASQSHSLVDATSVTWQLMSMQLDLGSNGSVMTKHTYSYAQFTVVKDYNERYI